MEQTDITPINTPEKTVDNRREDGTFGPGNIANPNGRPKKGHSITETIRAMMDEKPEIKKALGAKILQMAVEGDITAIKTIWNYLDGMPLQKSEIGGVDGQAILISAFKGFIPPGTPITSTPDGSHAIESGEVQDDSVASKG
jgi:hypothetical protein